MAPRLVAFAQVLARVAWETGLLGEAFQTKKSPAPLVTALCGLRGDRLEAAHLALAARLPDYQPATLLKALQDKRALVRTWGAHGAFQVMSALDLSHQLAAAGLAAPRWRRYLDARSNLAATARFRLLKRLCPSEISKDALRSAIPDASTRQFMLREAAQVGLILWKHGDGPQITFAWTESWLGREVRPNSDFHGLVGRYLSSYGPVDAADLAGWLGVTVAAARKLMAKHKVVEVQVDGEPGTTFMKPEDLEALVAVRKGQSRGLIVIPPGDPVLHATRARFHPDGKEGTDEGLVYLDGRLVAVWSLVRGQVSIRYQESHSGNRILKSIVDILQRAGIEAEVQAPVGSTA